MFGKFDDFRDLAQQFIPSPLNRDITRFYKTMQTGGTDVKRFSEYHETGPDDPAEDGETPG